MKKILITAAVIVGSTVVFAQKNQVQSAFGFIKAFDRNGKCSELQNGLEAINSSIEHETTKTWAKTWLYRGHLYYSVLLPTTDQNCKDLYKEALDEATDSYLKALVLNFEDPELKKLDLNKEDGSDVMKFFSALQNKSKVDDESYTGLILGMRMPGLAGEYANKGIENFQAKDYKKAQENFGKSMMLNQLAGKMDTVMMFNTALASEYAEDYEAAKQLYNALIQLKYNVDGNGPSLYQSLSRIHKKEGDKEKSLEVLQAGRKAYPNNQGLIFEEIDYFLQADKAEDALTSLNTAIELEPTNAFLYYVRGTVQEKLENKDAAILDYKKSLELDPKQHDAAYNLGAYYFNKGVDKINEANDLPLSQSKKFEAMKAEAKKDFESAIPYVEMANTAKPEDGDTATMLIKLYTQVGEYEKAKELKAKYQ